MSSTNSFGLLGDDDTDDPNQLLAAAMKSVPVPASTPAKKATTQVKPKTKVSANLPSKPLPPAQAVRDANSEDQRGGRGSGRGGRGRGGRGFQRNPSDNENSFGNTNGVSGGYRPSEDTDTGKESSERRRPYGVPRGGSGFRGGRRDGFGDGEAADGERPRRTYDRHSGTGRGVGFKREGAGRGNWGTPTDEISTVTEEPVIEVEKNAEPEKQSVRDDAGDASKEASPTETVEKVPEDKEMTLEEYEKVLEEKRKALVSLKSEERKVNLDKELEKMQLLSNKKNSEEVFVKLGSDKDKHKEAAEKVKKSVSINEFLKPAEGENYYRGGGRGQGRGRGRSGYGVNNYSAQAPAIEDVGQFPSLLPAAT